MNAPAADPLPASLLRAGLLDHLEDTLRRAERALQELPPGPSAARTALLDVRQDVLYAIDLAGDLPA